MKRKDCKAAMRRVATAAHSMGGEFSICNPSTGEVIEFDMDMTLHLVSATLAWAHELVDGAFDGCLGSSTSEIGTILRAAATAYVEDLKGGGDGVDSES